MNDAELIERYLGGDKGAGSRLVARHSNALFCWLRWKTGRREDAEDLTQGVWCRAFASLDGLQDKTALRAWLFVIMRREFAHWLRDHRAEVSVESLGETLDALALEPVCNALNAVEDRLALETALAQLSEEHRDTFMLRYLSQFSTQEVALILDIPAGTVESRCHFARERLRQWLKASDAPGLPQSKVHAVVSGEAGIGNAAAAASSPARKPWFKGHWR